MATWWQADKPYLVPVEALCDTCWSTFQTLFSCCNFMVTSVSDYHAPILPLKKPYFTGSQGIERVNQTFEKKWNSFAKKCCKSVSTYRLQSVFYLLLWIMNEKKTCSPNLAKQNWHWIEWVTEAPFDRQTNDRTRSENKWCESGLNVMQWRMKSLAKEKLVI